MREAGVGHCSKRSSNQQEAGDVAKAVDHCSMGDVIAGLGAAPAGRVRSAELLANLDQFRNFDFEHGFAAAITPKNAKLCS